MEFHAKLGITIERFTHGIKDARFNFGRHHRHRIRNECHFLQPFPCFSAFAVFIERRFGCTEKRFHCFRNTGRQLVLETFLAQAQKQTLLRRERTFVKCGIGCISAVAVWFSAAVHFNMKSFALHKSNQKALKTTGHQIDALGS